MAFLEFPHNLRSISRTSSSLPRLRATSRIVVCFAILASLVFVWYQSSFKGKTPQVLGTESTDGDVDVWQEIERTRAIIERRPDYAAAWLRLATLYEQMGEIELAADAWNTAVKLNPDLEGN